jgi:hypothetical protein
MIAGTENVEHKVWATIFEPRFSKKSALPRLASPADEAVNARAEPKLEVVAPSRRRKSPPHLSNETCGERSVPSCRIVPKLFWARLPDAVLDRPAQLFPIHAGLS